MQTYTYTKPHMLDQLSDELLAEIPALAHVPDPSDTTKDNAMKSVYSVGGRDSDDFITVTVPDVVTEREVAAVVHAHIPDPDYGKPVFADRASTMRTMPDAQFRETMIRWGKVANMLPEVDE